MHCKQMDKQTNTIFSLLGSSRGGGGRGGGHPLGLRNAVSPLASDGFPSMGPAPPASPASFSSPPSARNAVNCELGT